MASTRKKSVSPGDTPPAKASDLPAAAENPQFKRVRTAELLSPELPSRQMLDETALADLIESIRSVGLIKPLAVEPEGALYRIHAGHRRFIACQALGFTEIPCMVYQPGTVSGEAIKTHENAFHEDLNPAEEAHYFHSLLETRCGGDVDKLCEMVRQGRGHVEGRLLLMRGDEQVFAALAGGHVSIGVAQELNKVHSHERRAQYLDAAVKGGASVRMVRDWRTQGNALDDMQGNGANSVPAAAAAAALPAQAGMVCILCNSDDEPYDMVLVYLHKSCQRATARMAQGQPAGNHGT